MLTYTGHPIVDVGIAAITAYSKKNSPSELTEKDLEAFAQFMERIYFGEWKSWIFSILPNSPYTQPKIGEEKKANFQSIYTYGFRQQANAPERCVFCGQPALSRGFRQHVPLITGEGAINFFPDGDAGLLACGKCFLAIQAFLLGSVRCGGRALFVHSDDENLILDFAKLFLTENRRSFSLELKNPRTYFVAQLLNVERERVQSSESERPVSITVYHLTNYGTNPDVNIYHFPAQLIRFLRAVNRAPYKEIWQEIARQAWELPASKKKKKKEESQLESMKEPDNETESHRSEPGYARNYLYEDLFDLPHNASRFVRTYFLRQAYKTTYEQDPRRAYSLQRELQLVSWNLTQIFLKEVINMSDDRIKTIKRVADRMADHIRVENDSRLFRSFLLSGRYHELRRALVIANANRVREGNEPLLTFDDFVTIFEYGEDSQRPDWSLARDLLLIGILDQLHQQGWFKQHQEVLTTDEIDSATSTVEQHSD